MNNFSQNLNKKDMVSIKCLCHSIKYLDDSQNSVHNKNSQVCPNVWNITI